MEVELTPNTEVTLEQKVQMKGLGRMKKRRY